MLEARSIYKTYAADGTAYDALRGVDLKIKKAECLAIVGKSGSGKSTLMHLLSCLDEPTKGRILFGENDVSTFTEREKNLLRNEKFGFVFQQFFLNGRETVLENVALPLRIRGMNESNIKRGSLAALESVGLGEKAGNRAKDLSGGEKQRVCIARALVGGPEIIFADEPTGNLDSATGGAVADMLFTMNRERGITLVIVTHDAELADRCSRIVSMKDGMIDDDTRRDGDSK